MSQKKSLTESLNELLDRELEKYKSGDKVWEEIPVSIEEFVKSPDYLDWGEQVYPGVLEDLKNVFVYDKDGNLKYSEVILLEGLGSGKSQFAAIALTYIVYRLLCLRSPQSFYGCAGGDRIQLINCSPSADQARKVVFSYVMNHVRRCKWFSKKGYGPDPNVESELRFPKGIYITPGSSTARTVIGANLLVAVVDEMAFFDRTKERDQAEELYTTLTGRMKSRFGLRYLFIGISSARYVDDFIETLFKKNQIDERGYARRRAVWEAKPPSKYQGERFSFDVIDSTGSTVETLEVPIEYKPEFDLNPSLALRDLAARPSLTIQPFFKEFERVNASIDTSRVNPLPEMANEYGQPLPVSPLQAYMRLPDWFRGQEGVKYIVGLDLAKGARDKCGFALVHQGEPQERIRFDSEGKQVTVKLPTLYVDLVTRFVAPPDGEIDFGEIREFIHRLNIERGFKIHMIVSDTYQSLDFRQIMTGMGYRFEEFSVDSHRVAYDTFQSLVYDSRISWYRHVPLLWELQRLEDQGTKIDHSRTASKDIADALVIASYFAVGEKMIKLTGDKPRKRNVKGVLTRGIFSSGGSSLDIGPRKLLP